MIRVTREGAYRSASPAMFAEAREQFDRRACLAVRGLVDQALLECLFDAADHADFYEREHPGIGAESCLSPGALTAALELIFNDVALLTLVDELTGCGPFGCFDGRVYRLV